MPVVMFSLTVCAAVDQGIFPGGGYSGVSGIFFRASTVVCRSRPACCIKAHVVMHCPVQIVNELRIISVANEEVVQLPDVAIVLILSIWFVFDSNRIPNL